MLLFFGVIPPRATKYLYCKKKLLELNTRPKVMQEAFQEYENNSDVFAVHIFFNNFCCK